MGLTRTPGAGGHPCQGIYHRPAGQAPRTAFIATHYNVDFSEHYLVGFLAYRAKLKDKGVRVSPVIDHDDSEFGVARELHPGVFVRSFYFQDPDGILLEFACWRRAMGQPGDVRHEPKTAADRTGVPV